MADRRTNRPDTLFRHWISLLWQVAYVDGRLDKYEDSLVLKISELLYVSCGRVKHLKHDANPRASK